MKNNVIKIVIHRPVRDVFKFTANPENTPKWIGSIAHEEIDHAPIRVGTIYRNTNQAGETTEYEMIEYDPPATFMLRQKGGSYSVRYIFQPVDDHTTEFTYHEWVEDGDLKDPFPQSHLDKLKQVMEG